MENKCDPLKKYYTDVDVYLLGAVGNNYSFLISFFIILVL